MWFRKEGLEAKRFAARFRLCCVLLVAGLIVEGDLSAVTGRGVLVRIDEERPGGETDFLVLPNFELYVPEGEQPSTFLSPGRFRSEWRSEVRVPRRDSYRFSLECFGTAKLYLGDKLVLESTGGNARSEPVELGRGYNAIRLTLESPAMGDTFVRLRWESRELVSGPLPERFLKYESDLPAFAHSQLLRKGQHLYREHRCGNCHDEGRPTSRLDRLDHMGPSFTGIGGRRNQQWLQDWIMDPDELREEATMPDVLHGESEKEQARAIAAWLSTLRVDHDLSGSYRNGVVDSGAKLVESLHCTGCHKIANKEAEGDQLVSLERLALKYPEGELVAFLLEPNRHFAGVRMPNFQLSIEEAEDIASFLIETELAVLNAPASDPELIQKGKALVASARCVQCHEVSASDARDAVVEAMPPIRIKDWTLGCLDEAKRKNHLPAYSFSEEGRKALHAYGKRSTHPKLAAVRHEYAMRQVERLNCKACHGQLELIPPVSILGEKLKPDWAASLLEGELFYKTRPWLESRMPAFHGRGARIAEGLSMLNGFSPRNTDRIGEQGIDDKKAEIGKQLVSANGGMACVTCHGVGESPPTAVFESVGINFGYVNARLQRDYFHRWILKPTQIDPETKMPVYFFDGTTSPLPDILGGDAKAQIDAMWEYFKQGFDIQPPQ